MLCIGFTNTIGGDALTSLADAFQARYPDGRVILRETRMGGVYAGLRRDDIDVLVSWLAVDEPGRTTGSAIDHCGRALAVARGRPLAGRGSVSAEDLADHDMVWTNSAPIADLPALVVGLIWCPARERRIRAIAEVAATH